MKIAPKARTIKKYSSPNKVATEVESLKRRIEKIRSSLISKFTKAIQDEASERVSSIEELQKQIDFIISNSDPEALDSLTEIVEAFQAADGDLVEAIQLLATELQEKIDALEQSIEEIETRLDVLETLNSVQEVQEVTELVLQEKKFVLSKTPNPRFGFQLVPEGGIVQHQGVDFEVDGNIVTFANLGLDSFLDLGDKIYFYYTIDAF